MAERTMQAPLEGGGRDPYTSLIGRLRVLLGDLYDDSPGDMRDEAVLNMARLQIIAPPSTAEREQIADATPSDLRDWYEYTLLNQGGRSTTPGTMTWGGVEQNYNELFAGIERRVEDDNIDRQTIQDLINAREGDGSQYVDGGVADTPRSTPDDGGTDQQAAGDAGPRPTGGATSGGGTGGGGAGLPPLDDTLPEAGAPRQIPGGGELWRVGGRDVYLAYKIPGTNVPLVWKVENPDRLKAIYGDDVPDYDREFTKAQFNRQSPWYAGLSAEIQNTDEHPWQQFMSDFNQAADLRPWLNDPSMQAVMATAYLEGRAPTADELSQTDWWNQHSADERAWLEESVTMGRKEVRRRKDDAVLAVQQALREAGMDNAPRRVAEYIAMQRLTGKWSEEYTGQQVAKLADPWAPGKIDKGILAAIRDPELGEAADARAVSQGRSAVRDRVRAIFENRGVPIGTDDESEDQRLNRIAREVMAGERTFSDVRNSVDWLAARTDGGRPGGLDVSAEGEDRVRDLASQWLGPVMGQLGERQISEWAGRIRNNPDAEQEFVDYLRSERMAILPGYENPNLTYEDIIQPVRNLATNIWGQPVQDETLLVDLANMQDYTQMSQRLRKTGLEQNITKVRQDFLAGLSGTSLGEQVVRSQI